MSTGFACIRDAAKRQLLNVRHCRCIRSLFEYMDLKYVDMVKGKINKINKMVRPVLPMPRVSG